MIPTKFDKKTIADYDTLMKSISPAEARPSKKVRRCSPIVKCDKCQSAWCERYFSDKCISELYDDTKYQCRQCGIRLLHEDSAAHLDEHFKKNRSKKATKCRSWFPDVYAFTKADKPIPRPEYVIADIDDGLCFACGTALPKVVYEDAVEDWVLYGCLADDSGNFYHAECFP
jgi:hypothetical protein